jgi:hypothetical protein
MRIGMLTAHFVQELTTDYIVRDDDSDREKDVTSG